MRLRVLRCVQRAEPKEASASSTSTSTSTRTRTSTSTSTGSLEEDFVRLCRRDNVRAGHILTNGGEITQLL